ncbi:hypothetical protein B0H13DRAFT_1853231 [Mycena leptocephala]|nr:hypothetical protein B0H13DRAFT_1853231 [Mycena leptocephala]
MVLAAVEMALVAAEMVLIVANWSPLMSTARLPLLQFVQLVQSAKGVGRACDDLDTKENKRSGESTVTARTVKEPKIDPISNSVRLQISALRVSAKASQMGRKICRRTRPFPTHSRKKDHETYTKMVHPMLGEALNHAANHNASLK